MRCGNPYHKRIVWNVLCDDGSSGHKAVPAQYDTADNSRIRSNGCPLSHKGSFVLILPFYVTAWIDHIRKDHRWPAENIVFKLHSSINRDVILDLHSVADPNIWADYNILTEVAVASDLGTSHYMAE